MNRPLEGLRVVDCSVGSAGPQATGLLADYGADVIWVEPDGGDPFRRLDPAASSVFNRGKRSVILDPSKPSDREAILDLVDWADVFVGSWGQVEAAKLGLDFEAMHACNPDLVYCSITGFGSETPQADLPAYEGLVHALVGTMAQQLGHRDGPIYQGVPFAGTGGAQLAVIAILSALFRRLDDGLGRHVETSMLDGALVFHSMLWGESDAMAASKSGLSSDPRKMLTGATKMRLLTRSFLCGDGEYIGVHTGAVGAFDRLIAVLGLDDRIPPLKAGFAMGTSLTPEEAEALEANVYDIFLSHPRDYWIERLLEVDVCAVEHLRPTAAFDAPQTSQNSMTIKVEDAVLGSIDQVSPGIRFDGARPHAPSAAPRPGANQKELPIPLEAGQPSRWRPIEPQALADTRPPLEGIKIVDLGAYYAGPYSSRVLADLGAEVIKVEPTVGDQLRGIERPFFSAQAGKKSLACNLKDPALARAVVGLIKWADIIHHNMRPGAAERLGLGVDQVRAVNPDIIYLYAPGWGAEGPHRLRQSFAPMLSGYVGASYEVAGQYNEPMPSLGNEDPGNGLLGAIALLIGLLHRRLTGESVICENPQLNAAMGMMAHIVRRSDGTAIGAERLDVLQTGIAALDSLYQTADDWIYLVARSHQEIEGIELATGISILKDPRFDTIEARAANRDELSDLLRPVMANRTTADWLQIATDKHALMFRPKGSSCIHDTMNDPVNRKIGRVAEVHHAEAGTVRELDRLFRISGINFPPHRAAPLLGEHNDEILAGFGYSHEELAEIRIAGAIR